jgi:putative copper resistance protein D
VIDPIILVRAVHFAATTLAAGTVAFMALVAAPALGRAGGTSLVTLRRRANIMTWAALAAAIASGAVWLALLAADIYGAPLVEVCLQGGPWAVLSGTRFGAVSSARLAAALLLAVLLISPRLRWLQLAAAAALTAPLALIGHAGATPGAAGQLHLASDAVHLLAAGVWLGGLPALALLLAAARPPQGLAVRAAAHFSTLGIASVVALLASGIVNSWMLLSSPRDLMATDYGRLLFLKIGLFAAMLAIAAVNRFHLTPRLAGAPARRALMRNSLAETALGAGVLLLVGALGTMQPAAHHHVPDIAIPVDATFVHIHTEQAMADVMIDPGRAGVADASIRVMHEDSSEFPTDGIRLALDPPAPGPQPIERAAVHQSDGTWRVDRLELGTSGNWIVRVIVAVGPGKQIVLDAPIVIAPAQ